MLPAHLVLVFAILFAIGGPARGEDPPQAFQGDDPTAFPEYPDPPADAPEARLRIVFDLVSMDQEIAVEPNQPFEAHVLAHDVQIALRGWEATIVVDERLAVLEKEILGDINVGRWPEVFAALVPANCEAGATIQVARLRLMLTEPATDVTLGLAPTSRPSAITVPSELRQPSPVYLVCRDDDGLRPFDYCDTCAVVNPVEVRPEVDAEEPRAEDLFGTGRGRH